MKPTTISNAVRFINGSVHSFDLITLKDGIEETHFTKASPHNAEELIRDAFKINPDRLFIQLRKKNGSSTKKDKLYEVQNDAITVESNSEQQDATESNKEQQDATASNGEQQTLNGIETQEEQNTMSKEQVSKEVSNMQDYIIRQLERELEGTKKKCEKLETQNEALKKENQEISLELKTKDKEFELAMRSKELDQKEEKSGTLGGVAETLMQNEMGQNLLIGLASRIMGVQGGAMPPPQEQPTLNQAPTPAVEFEMQDEQKGTAVTREIAKRVQTWILEQEDLTAKGFYQLVQAISNNAKLIGRFLKQLQNQA